MKILGKITIMTLLILSLMLLFACGQKETTEATDGTTAESTFKIIHSEPLPDPAFGEFENFNYSMLIINYYTDYTFERLFYIDGEYVDGILAEVDVLFNPFDELTTVEVMLPKFLYDEGYTDYIITKVYRRSLNGESYYSASATDGKMIGFAFKDGRIDFSNEHFWGEEYGSWDYINKKVEYYASYTGDSDRKKEFYPDYCLADGLSAKEVLAFFEGIDKAADIYWADRRNFITQNCR